MIWHALGKQLVEGFCNGAELGDKVAVDVAHAKKTSALGLGREYPCLLYSRGILLRNFESAWHDDVSEVFNGGLEEVVLGYVSG